MPEVENIEDASAEERLNWLRERVSISEA